MKEAGDFHDDDDEKVEEKKKEVDEDDNVHDGGVGGVVLYSVDICSAGGAGGGGEYTVDICSYLLINPLSQFQTYFFHLKTFAHSHFYIMLY